MYFTNSKSEQGFAPILVVVIITLLVSGVAASQVKVTYKIKNTPQLKVLGDSEEDKGEEAIKKLEEQAKEDTKRIEEIAKEEQKNIKELEGLKKDKTKIESQKSNKQLIKKNEVKVEGSKQETEIETIDGQKIKTKVEDDGSTKIEIEQGKIKLKYVSKDGEIILKAENENGEEVELGDDDLAEIEGELDDNGVKISTESGTLAVSKNGIRAAINFPLSIEVETNRLIVETPAGMKVVTILPDQAVTNMLATGKVNVVESSPSANLESLDGSIKLIMKDENLVYEILGKKEHKLLGFIPVESNVTVFVSAETGDIVAQEQSVLSMIVDFLSTD